MGPLRYTAVPWLAQSDLDEGPRCMWDVEYQRDYEKVSCWPVTLYHTTGPVTEYLMLHATRGNGNDGGRITLSLSVTPRFDLYAQEVLTTVPAHSNHRRREDA